MSLGINLLMYLTEIASKSLGDNFLSKVFEVHHKHKKDHPSGTALMLGKGIATGKNKNFYKLIGKKYLNKKIFPFSKKINFNSIRKGEMKVIEMPDLENGGEPLLLHFDLEKNPEETVTLVGPAGDSPLDRTQSVFQIPPLLLKSLRSMQKIADQFSLEGERALLGADVMQALEEMGYVGEDGGRLLDDD